MTNLLGMWTLANRLHTQAVPTRSTIAKPGQYEASRGTKFCFSLCRRAWHMQRTTQTPRMKKLHR